MGQKTMMDDIAEEEKREKGRDYKQDQRRAMSLRKEQMKRLSREERTR